jgi:hypothetical protein
LSDANWLLGIAAAVLAAGLVLLPGCWRALRNAHGLRAAVQGLAALTLSLAGALGLLTGSALHAWRNLVWEQPVAIVEVRSDPGGLHTVQLISPGRASGEHYLLAGEQWRLEARVLRWKAPASTAGLRPRYRLERLSGRHERSGSGDAATAFDLDAGEQVPLVIAWLTRLQHLLPWVDSIYGSAVYMPLADGARFEVLLARSGLVARPVNEAAARAVTRWQ